jgi:hypothetical protein
MTGRANFGREEEGWGGQGYTLLQVNPEPSTDRLEMPSWFPSGVGGAGDSVARAAESNPKRVLQRSTSDAGSHRLLHRAMSARARGDKLSVSEERNALNGTRGECGR